MDAFHLFHVSRFLLRLTASSLNWRSFHVRKEETGEGSKQGIRTEHFRGPWYCFERPLCHREATGRRQTSLAPSLLGIMHIHPVVLVHGELPNQIPKRDHLAHHSVRIGEWPLAKIVTCMALHPAILTPGRRNKVRTLSERCAHAKFIQGEDNISTLGYLPSICISSPSLLPTKDNGFCYTNISNSGF
jgi:hypothetical protein